MRRLVVRLLLAIAGSWIAATVVPGVQVDGDYRTYLLMGVFIGLGEMALFILQGGAAIIFFFIPRLPRNFALRMLIVVIAAGLTSGFGFTPPFNSQLVGVAGTTLVYSLLFLLPFSS